MLRGAVDACSGGIHAAADQMHLAGLIAHSIQSLIILYTAFIHCIGSVTDSVDELVQ